MQKPTYRKMWMFPRNIRFIAPWKLHQIASILYASVGNPVSQKEQDQLYDQLAQLGVKVTRNADGIGNAGGMRTYFAQLACLGFFWKTEAGKWETTTAGEELIAANDPLKVIRCQLLRMQYPSVYGNGHNVQCSPEMHVKPFAFLVRLLMEARLGKKLSADDMAVAVVYARTDADYEKVVDKILKARDQGIESIIDTTEDLCTPRRWNAPDDELFQKGVEDARTIGNTAKNYLEAAQLIYPCGPQRKNPFYTLISDKNAFSEINFLLDEKLEPAPEEGEEAVWQRRFGRYNKLNDKRRTTVATQRDGRTALLQSFFIRSVEASPYEFDVKLFCKRQAASWNVPIEEIIHIVAPLISRIPTIERNIISAAAISGSDRANILEKAIVAIFRRLGFDLTERIDQTDEDNQAYCYPNMRIRASTLSTCGLADLRSIPKYIFPGEDTKKLSYYYHDCKDGFSDRTLPSWFLYIAGGFSPNARSVEECLRDCYSKYGLPVSAISVNTLLDLVDAESQISANTISRIFSEGVYIKSVKDLYNKV